MTFTSNLPTTAAAYRHKRLESDDEYTLVEVVQIADRLRVNLHGCWCSLQELGGLWSGPLLAPQEVKAIQADADGWKAKASQLSLDLYAAKCELASSIPREVFRSEVGLAFEEAYVACYHNFCCGLDAEGIAANAGDAFVRSRACKIASATEEGV